MTRRVRLQRTMQDPHRAARRARNASRQARNGRGQHRGTPLPPGTLMAIFRQES